MNMSRKTLAWANKEVETFLCILGEEDVVYDVYVAAAAIDIRPTKGTVGGGNATSELSWAIPPPPYRTEANRTVPHPAVEKWHKHTLPYLEPKPSREGGLCNGSEGGGDLIIDDLNRVYWKRAEIQMLARETMSDVS